MLPMTPAEAVRFRLISARVRAPELAKVLHVSRQQASQILSGKTGVAMWHLDRIAALLNISVADLFRDLPRQSPGVDLPSLELGGGPPEYEGPATRALSEEVIELCERFVSALHAIITTQEQIGTTPHSVEPSGSHPPHRVRRPRKTG